MLMVKKYQNRKETNLQAISSLILIFLLFSISIFSQENEKHIILDSLGKKAYTELSYSYYNSKQDTSKSRIYARAYLQKAKKHEDKIKIADGYLFLLKISDELTRLKYCDSIVELTKGLNDKRYPAQGYFDVGFLFYYERDFKNAIDYHIKAHNYAKKNNPVLAFRINHNIAVLRNRMGDYEKALKIFKNSYDFVKNDNFKNQNNETYLKTLFALSNAFRRTHELDSALYYCNLGIRESKYNKNKHYYNFLLTKAILEYNSKKLESSISNILIVKKFHEESKIDTPNLAFAYFYYAKILLEKKDTINALKNFKKVDSIFQIQNDIHPELRDTYIHLIDHYKRTNNKNFQLEYIEKLIKVDSVLNSNYQYLNKKIIIDYDTPLLISEKEILISDLEKEKRVSLLGNILLIIGILIVGFLFLITFIKKQKYQKKFDLLMQEKVVLDIQKTKSDKESNNLENIGISKEVVNQILFDLNQFVKNEEYLNSNITIGDLARKFKTNTKYLSKVINVYHQKNFINYINDLRVTYAIERIKTDQKFRKYSIKAISETIGYGKAESFSNAFKRRTGIKPSYFIKQLENQE